MILLVFVVYIWYFLLFNSVFQYLCYYCSFIFLTCVLFFHCLKNLLPNKGYVEGDGRFSVQEMLFNESGPQKTLTPLEESPLLVIMSGINIVSPFMHPIAPTNTQTDPIHFPLQGPEQFTNIVGVVSAVDIRQLGRYQ
jgi:hypothetical protein